MVDYDPGDDGMAGMVNYSCDQTRIANAQPTVVGLHEMLFKSIKSLFFISIKSIKMKRYQSNKGLKN